MSKHTYLHITFSCKSGSSLAGLDRCFLIRSLSFPCSLFCFFVFLFHFVLCPSIGVSYLFLVFFFCEIMYSTET